MNAPPVPERRPHFHTEHDLPRPDPWWWLRDREDPAVRAHIEAENRWTEQQLAGTEALRDLLYQEFVGRIQETDSSFPVPHGPYRYYHRTVAGSAYPIYCRSTPTGAEQILVDVNALAVGQPFTSVRAVDVSPDHALVAYATDFSGQERYTLRFRDPATGLDLPDTLPDASGSVAWASDSRTVWFTTLDAAMRSHRVWRYTLGGGPPTLVLDEPDDGFRLSVSRTRSGRFLRVTAFNASTTETFLAPADAPDATPVSVIGRVRGQRYSVSHAGDSLFIATNVGTDGVPGSAVNLRLVERPLDGRPEVERIAHRADVELVRVDGFRSHVVLVERDRGQLGLRILGVSDGSDRQVPLPERPCVIDLGSTPEYDAPAVRFDYTSMTTPPTDFDVDLQTLALTRLREHPVPGYDRTRYHTERIEVAASDGVRVPVSIVRRADLGPGPHPMVLYGYGAYGITVDPTFSTTRVSLLDRGVVYAIAHVRGGGFLGRAWYEAGKFANKPNSFSDFVSCGRALVASGVTAPDRLVAMGGSAGGLLVGAAANLAPDLFRGVLAAVPFVDVLTTMFDTSLPLTIPEFDEWGNPAERAVYDVIRSYSPYDNVGSADGLSSDSVLPSYPDVFATAGWNDPRVQYWEPVKWIARLRERCSGEFLLHTELGAGHQGPSGRYGALRHRALEYAWILRALGRAGP
ncbi:MAG: S9 family peptidase [Myxococcota bacterium]